MNIKVVRALLKARYTNEFKLNQLFNKTHRNIQAMMMPISLIIIIFAIAVPVALFTHEIAMIGLEQWIPILFWLVCHIVLLVFNAFIVYPNFFDFQDFGLLRSLPIKLSTIIFSRFLFWYLIEVIIVAIVIFPALVVAGYTTSQIPLALSWLVMLSLIAPAVTLAVSLVVCIIAVKISQLFKQSKTVYNSVNLVMILLIATAPVITTGQFMQLDLSDIFSGTNIIYLLIRLENITVPFTDATSVFSWVLISLVVVTLTLSYVVFDFNRLNVSLENRSIHEHKVQNKQRSMMSALIHKELKLFLNVSIYLLNTAFMIISVPIAVVVLFFLPVSTVDLILLGLKDYLPLLPIIMGGILSMTNTTSVSLSLEGKHINLLKSLPVSSEQIYKSKVYFNHMLFIPPTLFSCLMVIFILKLQLFDAVFLVVIPVLMVIFSGWLGMLFNSLFQKYLWDNETQVVKQSIAVLLNILTVIALSFAGAYAVMVWSSLGDWLFIGLIILLTCVAKILLYKQPIKSI